MGIENTVYQKASERGKSVHVDERRSLNAVFNGEPIFNGFTAAQAKVAHMHKDATLGSHFHPDYNELFTMATGEAMFTLEDSESKARQTYSLAPGDVLMIPPKVAHKAFVKEGSILLGFTQKPYTSPKDNDVPYEIKD